MRTFIQSIIALATAGASLSETNAAVITNFAIGLSPYYSPSASAEIEHNVKKFTLDAPKGSYIRLDDAFSLKTIAVFSVPDLRYDSPVNRARILSQKFATLSQWFRQWRTNATPGEFSNSSLLRVPEYLDFVAGNGSAEPRSILLIGSPFALYSTEPTFSMIGSDEGPRIPSDGHLLAPLQGSPYGTAERKGRLRATQISWCYGSDNVWSNGLAKTLTMRFWSLFVKQQDAMLTTFTPDLATAFAGLPKAGLGAAASFDLNSEDSKIEMRVARPRQVPTWLPQTLAASNAPSLQTSTLTPEHISTTPPQRAARPVEATRSPLDLSQPIGSTVDIGVMWESRDSTLDLDLYVRPRAGAEELSYQKVRTPEGVYIHDWRQPNNTADFEWVKLNPGARLDRIEAWVNLYKGGGPISGRVAVHFENRVYTGAFHIPATQGNGGRDARTRQSSPNWTRLDLQKILTQIP